MTKTTRIHNPIVHGRIAAIAFSGILIFGRLLLPATLQAADAQNSADYNFTTESIDGGGLRTASGHYLNDGSVGAGSYSTSPDYVQRGGYIGQLNNAPTATNYTFLVTTNGMYKIAVKALLDSATDADGDAISFVSVTNVSAQNGPVRLSGSWVLYGAPAGFTGTDRFTWQMQDSEGDRNTGLIVAEIGSLTSPPGQPNLTLISVTFDPAPGAIDATLRFASLPQSSYTVQYTDNIAPPITWTTLGTATTTNGVLTIVDPSARSAVERYYRTVIVSP
jgi:hypothetical protein